AARQQHEDRPILGGWTARILRGGEGDATDDERAQRLEADLDALAQAEVDVEPARAPEARAHAHEPPVALAGEAAAVRGPRRAAQARLPHHVLGAVAQVDGGPLADPHPAVADLRLAALDAVAVLERDRDLGAELLQATVHEIAGDDRGDDGHDPDHRDVPAAP